MEDSGSDDDAVGEIVSLTTAAQYCGDFSKSYPSDFALYGQLHCTESLFLAGQTPSNFHGVPEFASTVQGALAALQYESIRFTLESDTHVLVSQYLKQHEDEPTSFRALATLCCLMRVHLVMQIPQTNDLLHHVGFGQLGTAADQVQPIQFQLGNNGGTIVICPTQRQCDETCMHKPCLCVASIQGLFWSPVCPVNGISRFLHTPEASTVVLAVIGEKGLVLQQATRAGAPCSLGVDMASLATCSCEDMSSNVEADQKHGITLDEVGYIAYRCCVFELTSLCLSIATAGLFPS